MSTRTVSPVLWFGMDDERNDNAEVAVKDLRPVAVSWTKANEAESEGPKVPTPSLEETKEVHPSAQQVTTETKTETTTPTPIHPDLDF